MDSKLNNIFNKIKNIPLYKSILIFIPIVSLLTYIAGSSVYSSQSNTTNTKNSLSENLNINQDTSASTQTIKITTPTTINNSVLTLDPNKNYGNKYANGILPVGDKKYTTTSAQKGYIFLCHTNFNSNAGAQKQGPWFINSNEWNINKKISVTGKISWKPSMTIVIQNGKRIITTNNLPNHLTGIFPIQQSDPAHKYDGNPNKITEQNLTYTLNASPQFGEPQCENGQVGIMLTGVAIFNGFDAEGRDAGAWEIQDSCDGHPQEKGEYHYHTLSKCITDQSVSTVIGYALDGFPITGPKVADNNILTTQDLDICHGITSTINIDGMKSTMYHYVMTEDFPYSINCYRGIPSQVPGEPEGNLQNQQSPIPSNQLQNTNIRQPQKQLPPPNNIQ